MHAGYIFLTKCSTLADLHCGVLLERIGLPELSPISSHQRPDSGHPGSAVSGQAAVLARRTRTERARKHTTNSENVPPIARWQRSIPANFGIPRRYATRCDRLEVESNCITDLEQTALLNKNPCAWCTPCLSAANA
jgi:hypothetical protein